MPGGDLKDRFDGQLVPTTYENGAQHMYGVDAEGKKVHISNDEVLRAYGHDPKDSQANFALREPTNTTEPTPEPVPIPRGVDPRGVEYDPPVETEPGAAEMALYQTLMAAREAHESGNNMEFVRRLAELTAEINSIAKTRGLNKEQEIEFAQSIFAQIYGEAPTLNNPPDGSPDDGEPGPEEPEPTAEPELAPGPTQAERLTEAQAALEEARNALIDITIRRKARSWDGVINRGAADAEAYGPAMNAYKESLANYLQLRREGLEAQEGVDEKDISEQLTIDTYAEQRLFEEQGVARNNAILDEIASGEGKNFFGKMWGKRANLLRRWANLSTKKKLLIGLGLGVGAGLASAGLGLGLAGLAGASAAKFSLGLFNRRASLRNVSERSRDQEIGRINRAQEMVLADLPEDIDWDEYRGQLIDRVESDLDGRIQHAQRRNRLGNALLLASGLAMGAGIAGLEGVIPNPNILHGIGIGGTHHTAAESIGASHIDMTHFHPGSFYGRTPHEAVGNMFGVISGNHIQAHGLTSEKINAITQDMMDHHWRIASGMEDAAHGGLRQHIVDVANNWAGGRTGNADASALQGLRRINGSSVENWQKFMQVATKHGVTFTQGG